MTDKDLDDLFAAARAAPPVPSAALMDRVMSDALAAQPAPPAVAAPASAPGSFAHPAGRPFWDALALLFGGRGALVGIGVAAVAGLVIGLVQPAGLAEFSNLYLGGVTDRVALLPAADALFLEVTQ